jgi:hypothetical protein
MSTDVARAFSGVTYESPEQVEAWLRRVEKTLAYVLAGREDPPDSLLAIATLPRDIRGAIAGGEISKAVFLTIRLAQWNQLTTFLANNHDAIWSWSVVKQGGSKNDDDRKQEAVRMFDELTYIVSDVATATSMVCQRFNVKPATLYRWRKKFSTGLRIT